MCTSFGVLCNFGFNIPDLQPVTSDTGRSLVRSKPALRSSITNAIWTSDEFSRYQLSAKCQDFVTRYYGRSLLTPDDPNMLKVNESLFKLAFTYPCLMHASLAVALTYDRYLNTTTGSRRTLEECYHWSQSTALFNEKLRRPVKTRDKDPIWGTAAALAVLTFSSPDAYRPEDSWPMKPSRDDDLEWVSMINGKMSLWQLVEPTRVDSLFHVMGMTFDQMLSPLPEFGTHGIPEPIAEICLLHDLSTADDNPYFYAAHAVSHVLNLPDSEITTGHTQLFTHRLDGAFKALLLERDPVALLLLYLWYRKAGRSIWWIELRARVECPAIRICGLGKVADPKDGMSTTRYGRHYVRQQDHDANTIHKSSIYHSRAVEQYHERQHS
ncbi:putative c6 finger domain protein [Fusarium flagelliforme]|uniref:Putative c6 finger domain protein n=1 Tax=Fusarium flagelliforme TaxID=2675880 RepID=A0A395N2K3_9HYPO|nr:putative c6 finger domain protein [Fusarium flagelliforme]